MARKTASRLSKRREVEAAEAQGKTTKKKATKKKATKKKATKRKTTRSRAKKDILERRKLVWAIYGSTMKEEARFPYEEREEAEAKLAQLRSKSKKSYFIQPLKEPITKPDEDEVPPPADEPAPEEAEAAKVVDEDAEEAEPKEGEKDLVDEAFAQNPDE